MKLVEVTVEYGVTQNLGDYSNTRPSIRVTAELAGNDNAAAVIEELTASAMQYVHAVVDDELEASGQRVKYSKEPLYQIWRSKIRKALVLAPVGVEMPDESTWKDKDNWRYAYMTFDHQIPDKMRYKKALTELFDLGKANPDYSVVDCQDGDLSIVPPLPDPGPEPLWSKRAIGEMLRGLHIDESEWESLAELEHVTADWLRDLKGLLGWGASTTEYLEAIRSGELPAEKVYKRDEYYDLDEDEFDEDEDRPF